MGEEQDSASPNVDGRRAHYSAFYGLDDAGDHTGDGIALVIGNCQAESLRIALDGPDLPTVRVPAVHELTADDIRHLDRLLGRARLLVSQPIRDDYHDLPLGTRQLADRLASAARLVTISAIRHTALYPLQVIVRKPGHPASDPPIVPYHDLRVLARAAGLPEIVLDAAAVREAAEASTAELRRREQLHGAVPVSDLFAAPRFAQMRTINHPGNPVFLELAARVRETAGLSTEVRDPGRPLLNAVHAPRDAAVIDAWGLDDAPTDHWRVDGVEIAASEIERIHLDWYAANPDLLQFARDRHEATLRRLASS